MLTHSGEKPFGCTQCNNAFTTPGSLKKHVLTHSEEKPFRCEQCSYSCRQPSNLKYHILSHTGEKPFACKYCNKNFSQLTHVIHHERIHTGEKPFTCKYCENVSLQYLQAKGISPVWIFSWCLRFIDLEILLSQYLHAKESTSVNPFMAL